jgi:N-acetylglucosaminyl-diphospho-decaprenol L-rhamnosyltransferase
MHGTRNLMWCFAKCMPPTLYWPLLPLHLLTLAFLMARATATGMARPVGAGIAAGFAGMPAMWSSRRAVQRARRVPLHRIAAALTWNPARYLRREPYTW